MSWPGLAAAQTPPAAAPQPTTLEGASALVYKSMGGVELRLHVFSPARSEAGTRHPAIVFFFGGGWRQGLVTQFVPQARHFASRGMVAIVADYRVAARHQTTPFHAMADAKSAIRWVRVHAAELGVDPGRIAAGGGSAGGHIALSAAAIENGDEPGENEKISSKPNALVLFNPVVDTSRIGLFGDRARDASPFHQLTRALPPTLILHGRADATVPYADVVRFCEKATSLGARCQLVGYDGAPHGFFNPQREGGKWHRETLLEADRFLTRLGFLPQPATVALSEAAARSSASGSARAESRPPR
jgi:acetyl esterase/lipase